MAATSRGVASIGSTAAGGADDGSPEFVVSLTWTPVRCYSSLDYSGLDYSGLDSGTNIALTRCLLPSADATLAILLWPVARFNTK